MFGCSIKVLLTNTSYTRTSLVWEYPMGKSLLAMQLNARGFYFKLNTMKLQTSMRKL